jgi:hypothetical protein
MPRLPNVTQMMTDTTATAPIVRLLRWDEDDESMSPIIYEMLVIV